MSDMNLWVGSGRLGRDPERKEFASGDAVVSFSMACSKKWKSKAGEPQEKTTWVNVKAFGKLGDVMFQYLTKGSQVLISGELEIRKYEKSDGTDGYATEVIAEKLTMLGGKKDGEQSGQRASVSQHQRSTPTPADDDGFADESIPF